MFDQGAHPLDAVGRHQTLLREHFFQLFVVFVGERGIVRLFDDHTAFLRLSHAAPAGAIHSAKNFFFSWSNPSDRMCRIRK